MAHPFATRIAAGVPLLVSEIIPDSFGHGFTTRAGGVSEPPFDSLNLGHKWGDHAAHVAENQRRLLAASSATALVRASQVHGTRVLRIRASDGNAVHGQSADGLCTGEPGVALSVHVADCTPIVLACPVTHACAVLHAGWRGTVAGIASAGVRALAELGCRPENLRVALGPCIGPCCFEVGEEVAEAFAAVVPSNARDAVILRASGKKPHIDLRLCQSLQFAAEGVGPEHIDVSGDCTFCDPGGRFFSFRRHGRATGQLVGYVFRRA
jgi:YfiH family protein